MEGDLITELEDAIVKQRPNCMSGFVLGESREKRYQGRILHRLHELEGSSLVMMGNFNSFFLLFHKAIIR